MIAAISPDAIFAAFVALFFTVVSAAAVLVRQSFNNGNGIKGIQETLTKSDVLRMRTQVDELWLDRRETWRYLNERGDAEALSIGAKRNSPVSIQGTDREREMDDLYAPYLPELLEIDREITPQGLGDNALFEAVAKRLGERLIKEVCPILGTNKGGCVSIALAVLRKHRNATT